MKKLEIEPNYLNIVDTIREDALGRNVFISNFIRLLASIEGNYSIALDGRWGSGKTFFVKQTECVLEQLFDKNVVPENIIKNQEPLKKLFDDKNVTDHPMITFYYDAWRHDSQQDALLSLIWEMTKFKSSKYFKFDSNKNKLYNFFISMVQVFLNLIIQFYIKLKFRLTINGIFTDLVIALQNDPPSPLVQLQEHSRLNQLIDRYLNSILPPKPNRFVIFIDELDRCRPDYAVKLLERVKHFMTLYRITFVFSLNYDQLQHTIKRYYGDDFEASMYLDKFFDLHISLPVPDLLKRRKAFHVGPEGSIFDNWCQLLIDEFHFEVREQIHFKELILQTILRYDRYFEDYDPTGLSIDKTDGTLAFLNYYVTPLALALRIKDINLYYAFIDGKNNELIELIHKHSYVIGVVHLIRTFGLESLFKTSEVEAMNSLKKKIIDLYYCIFEKTYQKNEHHNIGKLYVDGSVKQEFINHISILRRTLCY